MALDASAYQTGVPELVAAELVRDVVEPKEFDEFCRCYCVTVRNGDKFYRIPRHPHGLIEVWDAKTHRALVYQALLRTDVQAAVDKAGGKNKIVACGTIMTEGFQVPMLAYYIGVHTLTVEAPPAADAPPGPAPNVVFQAAETRDAALLPVLHAWPNVHYQLIGTTRTFRVFEHCAGKVAH